MILLDPLFALLVWTFTLLRKLCEPDQKILLVWRIEGDIEHLIRIDGDHGWIHNPLLLAETSVFTDSVNSTPNT